MDPIQNNSFGGQQPMSMGYSGVPMSTGTGDIVLNNGGGKSKKWWIIGGVVVVLIVIMLIIWCIFHFTNGGKGGIIDFRNVREKYNVYANYLVNGEESAENISGEYRSYDWYALDEAFETENDSFFQVADRLWNDFYDSYSGDEELRDDALLAARIGTQSQLMKFILLSNDVKELSGEELLRVYMEKGLAGANDTILRRYEPFRKLEYEGAIEYSDAEVERAKVFFEVIEIAVNNSCLEGNTMNWNCLEGKVPIDLADRLTKAMSGDALDMPEDVIKYTMYNCWEIAMELSAGNSISDGSATNDNANGDAYEN